LERNKKGNAKRDPKEKKKTKKKKKKKRGYGAGISVRWFCRIGIRRGKCLMWVSMFLGKKQEAAWTLNAALW
jgi:hypothetical protein